MTMQDPIDYEVIDHVAVITINRPHRMNAFDRAAFLGLAEAFIALRDDDDARVGVLTGAGERAFCAGLDVLERTSSGERGLDFPDTSPLVNPFWPGRRSRVGKPVISAVNGYAMGGGFYLAMQADLVVAGRHTQFEISEIWRGGVAGWETGFLENLPLKAWAEIAYGGRLTATRAHELGLVNRVVEPGGERAAAIAWAREILRLPPIVLARNRELVESIRPVVDPVTWQLERIYIEQARASDDAVEAMAAFLDKREPVWSHDRPNARKPA